VFGDRLVSSQSIAVSYWFSLVSFEFAGTYLAKFTHYQVLLWQPLVGGLLTGLSVVCVAYIFISKHRFGSIACLVFGYFLIGIVGHRFASGLAPGATYGAGIAFFSIFVGGFCCDAAFVAITRRVVQWAGEMTRSWKVIAILLLNVVLAIFLVGPAFVWSDPRIFQYLRKDMRAVLVISTISMTNMIDGAFALLFVFLALILLLHRTLWPLLTRTLFRMTDIGTKGRRSILVVIGVALLSASVFGGKLPELLKDLVKGFGG
jgi:hypothetical protein